MSLDIFFEHFEVLPDAPNGVQKLRKLILQLAVQGKLVPQDPNDEPVSMLIENIKAEKARLNGQQKLWRDQQAEPATDAPFDIPTTWYWYLLEEVVDILDYKRVPINQEERDQRTQGKPLDQLFPYYGATQQVGWIDDYLFDEELVLLGEDGVPFLDPYRPKAYLIRGRSWVNNHAHVLRGRGVSNKFLCYYLNICDYRGLVTGTTRLGSVRYRV